jgi:DNA repair protein SbcC/Rad50
MLLQKLTLNNIRSYSNETINFTKGSTLLSGDIGSGKSSILLAIEFSLFGSSRTELPAEALLRKGTTNGWVELTFILNNQEIIIKRNLKKDKNSIKQLAGHIIINNQKKELMPTELKAELLNLLGYPEDLISKSKNYIFRYTVYTPQEDMKQILQESSEIRSDVLRKIFNIDKYKNIRDNLQMYLKKMRTQITISNTRIEPLSEEQEQLQIIKEEKNKLEKSITVLQPLLEEAMNNTKNSKIKLESIEKEQKNYLEAKNKLIGHNNLLKSKEAQQEELTKKIIEKKEKLIELKLPEKNKIEIEKEVKEIEEERNKIIQEKSSLQEKINQIQKNITQNQQEIQQIQTETSNIEEKEKTITNLLQEIGSKETFVQKKEQMEELLQKTNELITKNKTLLQQSQDTKNKIHDLENCPLCLQDVQHEHKAKIIQQEDDKIKQAETLLSNINQNRDQIISEKKILLEKIEKINEQEKLLAKNKAELEQLHQKKEQIEKKKEQLKSLVQENNSFMERLSTLQQENRLELLQKTLLDNRKLLELIQQKELFEQQVKEHQEQITEITLECQIILKEINELHNELFQKKDLSETINKEKEIIHQLLEEEKKLSVQKAELMTKNENFIQRELEIQQKVDQLTEEKNKLVRTKELYNWLNHFFLQLMYTIEKQVMVQIHYLFNQMFKEWFSILIEDENMYARIDDTFSPVIEQNGYEISFNHLSGGERTSAALAYRLALNRVINDVISGIKTKELLILDEPTDGFSNEQLDKVRDVLDKLNLQQTIIVSHDTKIESFVENVVRIRKEDHESVVV